MSPNPLTVIVKIKPGEEANLKSILEAIDSEPANIAILRLVRYTNSGNIY